MNPRIIAAILLIAIVSPVSANPPPEQIRAAVNASLTLLQKSAMKYTEHRECFSCHHQALPTLTFALAKKHGYDVDDKVIAHQVKHTADFLAKNRDNYRKGKGQGGQADTAGYALWALAAGGYKADDTTDAVVDYLLQRDKDRGYWNPVSQRPPSEASAFTTTYLGLYALTYFGPEAKKEAIDIRIDKARKWLHAQKPKDTEDRVFRLRALTLVCGEKLPDKMELCTAADDLVKMQRKDGGWAQLDKLDSDAYATGSVLVALREAGCLDVKSETYQRGVAFLLKSQHDNGSWYIKSRSKPFQLYFESGFPHTKDQWISCAGTSWATMALAMALDPGPPILRSYEVPEGQPTLLAGLLSEKHKDAPTMRFAPVGPVRVLVYADADMHSRIEREIRALSHVFSILRLEPKSEK